MQRLASPAPRLVILQYAVVFFERMHEGVHSDTYQHELAKTQQRKMENTGVTWANKQKRQTRRSACHLGGEGGRVKSHLCEVQLLRFLPPCVSSGPTSVHVARVRAFADRCAHVADVNPRLVVAGLPATIIPPRPRRPDGNSAPIVTDTFGDVVIEMISMILAQRGCSPDTHQGRDQSERPES